jgi:hypothetical protein
MDSEGGYSGKVYSARQILDELAMPAGPLREAHAALEGGFVDAVDPIMQLLFDADPTSEGERGYAIRSLLGRILNDLAASMHLLTHGYFTQAYGAMRMAYEASELLELLATDADQAALWTSTERGWTDFAPRKVREALGKASVDPLYSHLCELSHPRFASSKLSSFGVARVGSDKLERVVLRLGPSMIDGHPAIWHAALLLLQITSLFSIRSSHLAQQGAVTESAWTDALAQSMVGQQKMAETVAAGLRAFGQDAQEIVDLYGEKVEQILRGD